MFGVGGLGFNVMLGAALVNAYPIVAVDLHEHKLEQAKAFGATHTAVATRADVEAALKTLTNGNGFDTTVDTTGNGRVRELCYRLTSRTGKTILAGVPHHDERMTIDSFPIHFGRRLIGVHGGETKPDIDIPRYLALFRLGKLKLTEQITHRYALTQINEAIREVREGRVGRCVIHMGSTQ